MMTKFITVNRNSNGLFEFGTVAVNLDQVASVEVSSQDTNDLLEGKIASNSQNSIDPRAEVIIVHMSNGASYKIVGDYQSFVEACSKNTHRKVLLG